MAVNSFLKAGKDAIRLLKWMAVVSSDSEPVIVPGDLLAAFSWFDSAGLPGRLLDADRVGIAEWGIHSGGFE